MTKYRTRQTRAKAALHESPQWAGLSEKERAEAQKRVVEEIESKRKAELQATAKEWVKLAYGQGTVSASEQEEVDVKSERSADSEIEEWAGISKDNEDENDSWDGIQSADEEHEEDHDEVLEEGDIDVSDSEKFLDENGIEIERDIIADGLKNIWERHWQKIEKSLDLWANLS